MAKDFSHNSSYPLGLRNNNPGNLRYFSSINWVGQIGSNKGFALFANLSYGIRAFGMDLRNDIKKGKDTIEKLVYEFAPPTENNTEAYINTVVKLSGIGRHTKLNTDNNTLLRLARGMFSVELGAGYAALISDGDILEGLNMMYKSGGDTANIIGSSLIGLIVLITAIYFITK
jgi:hypothetical protein